MIPSKVFYVDGSLRDLLVKRVSISDWNTLLMFIKSHKLHFTLKNQLGTVENGKFSTNARDYFNGDLSKHMLAIHLGRVSLHCHFFLERQIEFDLDPREFSSETSIRELERFIRQISELLGKEVVITDENAEDGILYRFNSSTGAGGSNLS